MGDAVSSANSVHIHLPEDLYRELMAEAKRRGMPTVEKAVVDILREVIENSGA